MATKKRILITAGPTWVAIDQARVISNTASGETGFLLAEKFRDAGFSVTFLSGPGYYSEQLKGIRIVRYKFYAELKQLLKKELGSSVYSGIIHAAAVSDYRPKKVISGKLSSYLKTLRIELVPTKKLIGDFKKDNPGLFSVGFKFEPEAGKNVLTKKGRELLKKAHLDLVVANSQKNSSYCAYVLNKRDVYGPFSSKKKMAENLLKIMGNKLL